MPVDDIYADDAQTIRVGLGSVHGPFVCESCKQPFATGVLRLKDGRVVEAECGHCEEARSAISSSV